MSDSVLISEWELRLAYALPLSFLFGAIGSMGNDFTDKNKIPLPWFAPPPQWFGIVWSILYTLMGFAYAEARMEDFSIAIILFWCLIPTLSLWTWIYFKWKLIRFAAVWILLCLALSIATTFFFFTKGSLLAGFLILPLPIWVAFASILNIYIAANPTEYKQPFYSCRLDLR